MMLIKKVETYRCENEEEATALVQRFKDNAQGYEVIKSSITQKTKKSKGEIVDVFYLVEIYFLEINTSDIGVPSCAVVDSKGMKVTCGCELCSTGKTFWYLTFRMLHSYRYIETVKQVECLRYSFGSRSQLRRSTLHESSPNESGCGCKVSWKSQHA